MSDNRLHLIMCLANGNRFEKISYKNSEKICIRAKTSNFKQMCGSNKKTAFGSPIDILHNGNVIWTLPAKFRKFEKCLPYDQVDLKNDVFQFVPTGDDDVCITELYFNDQKMMFGKNQNSPSQGYLLNSK